MIVLYVFMIGILMLIACQAMFAVYKQKHLGETRIYTNGDKFVVVQYGYIGAYLDKWDDFRRECFIKFFEKGHSIGWQYINSSARAEMLGFGKEGNTKYEFDSLDDAKQAAKEAQLNFEEQRIEFSKTTKKWRRVKEDR